MNEEEPYAKLYKVNLAELISSGFCSTIFTGANMKTCCLPQTSNNRLISEAACCVPYMRLIYGCATVNQCVYTRSSRWRAVQPRGQAERKLWCIETPWSSLGTPSTYLQLGASTFWALKRWYDTCMHVSHCACACLQVADATPFLSQAPHSFSFCWSKPSPHQLLRPWSSVVEGQCKVTCMHTYSVHIVRAHATQAFVLEAAPDWQARTSSFACLNTEPLRHANMQNNWYKLVNLVVLLKHTCVVRTWLHQLRNM